MIVLLRAKGIWEILDFGLVQMMVDYIFGKYFIVGSSVLFLFWNFNLIGQRIKFILCSYIFLISFLSYFLFVLLFQYLVLPSDFLIHLLLLYFLLLNFLLLQLDCFCSLSLQLFVVLLLFVPPSFLLSLDICDQTELLTGSL